MVRIKTALNLKIQTVEVYVWSDSSTVLRWLKVPHEKCKVFVSNRIHKLTTLLPNCHWDYKPSVNNPADSASWDIFPTELVNHKLYWDGSDILYREVLDSPAIGPETN